MTATMTGRSEELDLAEARDRLEAAAEEAKRLEEEGAGWEANAAWKRYELIKGAIAAQERRARLARRLGAAGP
jgi:hypothetical protein